MMPLESTPQEIAQFRHAEGFDRPLWVQFGAYAWNALHGDFGDSLRHGEPALGLTLERVPASAELAFTALALALIVAIPAGIVAAVRRNSLLDLGGATLRADRPEHAGVLACDHADLDLRSSARLVSG